MHDAALPGDPRDDIGRGAPLSRGGLAFLRFAADLGFHAMQLGPQGETTEHDQSPYDATILNVVRLNKLQYGVHLVATARSLEAGLQQLVYTGSIQDNKPVGGFSVESVDGRSTEVWYLGRAGNPVVVIPFFVTSAEILHKPVTDLPALRFDLRKIGVLPVAPWTWR